jgi:hypothetical protein
MPTFDFEPLRATEAAPRLTPASRATSVKVADFLCPLAVVEFAISVPTIHEMHYLSGVIFMKRFICTLLYPLLLRIKPVCGKFTKFFLGDNQVMDVADEVCDYDAVVNLENFSHTSVF